MENKRLLSHLTRKISAILLLGGFQVFDKQGNNITGEFTPTLKLLFLFLLLNSIKGGKGTTSQRLEETFWFDMSKTSAVTTVRVNIRKLRLILETVGKYRLSIKMIIGILIWVKILYVIIIRYARS